MGELEQLQQILFYRELDFSLQDIKKALEDEPGRLECLARQKELLNARRQRLDVLLGIIEKSVRSARKGESMDRNEMFKGLNKEEWKEALKEQNEYLKDKYDYDMLKEHEVQADVMNEQAREAIHFTGFVAEALRNGWRPDDERLMKAIGEHISFLNEHGMCLDGKKFAGIASFNMEDDFHRSMLEGQQMGLAYYLDVAARKYAAKI
jgi:DNA-binding transcriptional MerR regulator